MKSVQCIQKFYKERFTHKVETRRKGTLTLQYYARSFLKRRKHKIHIDIQELQHLKMQIKILTEELEKQDVWLMKAKRLILLYQYSMKDKYLKSMSNELLE